MTIAEVLSYGGVGFIALLTLIQIAPIKIDPWSAIAKALGKAINADVLKKLEEVERTQKQTDERLAEHIAVDDARNADEHRARILRFNNELMRGLPHTREDFIEILAEIDSYERYCKENPEYPNSRAIHAISNIGRVYDIRLEKNDFYKANGERED